MENASQKIDVFQLLYFSFCFRHFKQFTTFMLFYNMLYDFLSLDFALIALVMVGKIL